MKKNTLYILCNLFFVHLFVCAFVCLNIVVISFCQNTCVCVFATPPHADCAAAILHLLVATFGSRLTYMYVHICATPKSPPTHISIEKTHKPSIVSRELEQGCIVNIK